MTLEYLREYRTYFHIAQTWGVYESTAYRIIHTVEDALISCQKFHLPGKKKLLEPNYEIEVVVVDVTESPIERPKKTKKNYYSAAKAGRIILPAYCLGKKKRHTLKSQVVVDQVSKQIICTAHGKGREHDFSLFKSSFVRLKPELICLADKGYQGLVKIHPKSCTPKKKPRGACFSIEDKHCNRQLAKLRVVGEQINRSLKILRILSERYRNRRRRFGLRLNLIAGLYNYELKVL